MFEKATIKKYKQYGIDIVIDDTGFRPAYYVYSFLVPNGARFESFKEVKEFCEELIKAKK